MSFDQIQSLYDQLNKYILGNFQLFWNIILGTFSIIGVALFFIAKAMVDRGVSKIFETQHRRYLDLEERVDKIQSEAQKTHPKEHQLPLESGFLNSGSCCYSKNGDNLVVVTISIRSADGNLKSGAHKIAVLPSDFAPNQIISQTVCDFVTIRIYKNGSICYFSNKSLKELSYSSIIFYSSGSQSH